MGGAALLILLLHTTVPATPAASSQAVHRGVVAATYFDVSPPLRDIAPRPMEAVSDLGERAPRYVPTHDGDDIDPAVQRALGVAAMPPTIANFVGMVGPGNITPPSPSGDAGPHHYVLMSNVRLQIFDKSGTSLYGPVNNNTLWAGFGGPCQNENAGDAIVLYDQLADRWLLSQFTVDGPTYCLCVALSVTGDPLGSYYRWCFNTGSMLLNLPKYAVWPDAYYVGAPAFDTGVSYAGVGTLALDRAAMLAGSPTASYLWFLAPPSVVVGDGLVPADLDGSILPPAGAPGVFLGSMDDGVGAPQDALTVWEFHADWVTPANSTFTLTHTLPTDPFDSMFTCSPFTRDCIPQPGTAQKLDIHSYEQRLNNRVAYRNLGTHQAIVACQSVDATGAPPGVAGVAGIRWYEIRDPHGTPLFYQQGTYAPGISDGIHRWLGSIAMDRVGNIALGYSASSATTFPSIRYTGRLAADPLGQMPQGEGIVIGGGGSQTGSSRWGDYSQMSVDPDDCTFWYTNEYLPVTSPAGWVVRVASFKISNCTTVGVEGVVSERTELAPLGLIRGPVEIRFTLGGAERRHIDLRVYDLAGRQVRGLMEGELAGGRYGIPWDRDSDQGTRLVPGVYFLRLRAGAASHSRTIVLLD